MSNPGFYAQQANRAGADAARRATQAGMDARRLAMSRNRRSGYRPSPLGWIARLIGGLFAAAFLLVLLAVGAFVVLSILQHGTP